jgi:hypothetical protein
LGNIFIASFDVALEWDVGEHYPHILLGDEAITIEIVPKGNWEFISLAWSDMYLGGNLFDV